MFTDKIVVVTGGSRGIGRAIVADFSRLGATVYFSYHVHEDAALETERLYGAKKIKCAQSDPRRINAAVDDICAGHGKIDVLINNAGITSDQFLMMMPAEDWNKVLDINLNGAFRWSKAITRPMLSAGKGVIINIRFNFSVYWNPRANELCRFKRGASCFFEKSCGRTRAKGGPRQRRCTGIY